MKLKLAVVLRFARSAGQLRERHVVLLAVGVVVDDRVEVDERVVPGRVLVVGRRRLRVVAAVQRRVAAGPLSRSGSLPMSSM